MGRKYRFKWGIVCNILIIIFIVFLGVIYTKDISDKIAEIAIVVLLLCILGLVIINIYLYKTTTENTIKLNKVVYKEHLTEINNYEKFMLDCIEYLDEGKKYALILFDIQEFKVLNDIYSRQVGDNILKEISKNLDNILGDSAVYARLSGDRFGILTEIKDIDKDISNLSDIIRDDITNFENIKNIHIKISISIGMCILEGHDKMNIHKLIDNADMARCKSKTTKHKAYIVFDEVMREEKNTNMQLEQDLYYAIKKEELEVYYQPKFDIERDNITGSEALLRWKHPTMGFVSPEKFIPIAENNGFINQIGRWIFIEVCETIRLWKDEGIDIVPISINLSRVELYSKDLIKFLEDILKAYNIPAELIELEITETTALNNIQFIKEKIYQIKNLGIKVSMDDFGVGNSNISNLKDIPIDTLKIDKSILVDINTNIKAKVVAESIINICKHLGLEMVGEGIENMEQVEILKSMGCKVIQGYVFYKPINKHQYKLLLQERLLIEEKTIE